MKVLKFFGNLIGVLVAIVLSLVLLVTMVTAPVFSGATNLVQNETLHSVVKSIDFAELLGAADMGEGNELVGQLMETEAAKAIINLYIDDTLALLDGSGAQPTLTVEAVKSLVQANMAELLPILRNAMGVTEGVTDQMLEQYILLMFDEMGAELINSLPTPQELGLGEEVLLAISLFRSKLLLTGVTIAIIVLSLLILLFRFPRFKGFMWLTVVYLLSAISAVGMGASISSLLPNLIATVEPMLVGVVTPIALLLSKSFFTAAAVMAIAAVVFILIFVFGRKASKKRKARKEAAKAAALGEVAEEEPSIPSYVMEGAAEAEAEVEPEVEPTQEEAEL